MKSPAEEQKAQKYAHHDWHLDDLTEWDRGIIRTNAISSFVNTKKGDRVDIVIDSFLLYLASKGYRITKVK